MRNSGGHSALVCLQIALKDKGVTVVQGGPNSALNCTLLRGLSCGL